MTEQIYKTQKEYNINATFRWVKGNQDNDTPYADLSLEAQLNIDADALAGEYQEVYGTYWPLVNILPSCPAMLTIRGISVTSNYRKQLTRAYVEPEYMQYLQYHYQQHCLEELQISSKSNLPRRSHHKSLQGSPTNS